MVFTGTYEHSIDAKNRLAIPADLRSRLRDRSEVRQEDPIYLYVTLGEGNALYLYSETDFERRAQELHESELDVEELLQYERVMFSLSRRTEIDKQGRVRLPENLLKMTGLSGDVVILGNNDHMEVHDREAWNATLSRTVADNPGILMNFRRAMRRTDKQG